MYLALCTVGVYLFTDLLYSSWVDKVWFITCGMCSKFQAFLVLETLAKSIMNPFSKQHNINQMNKVEGNRFHLRDLGLEYDHC